MIEEKWRHYLWSLAHHFVMESHFRVVEVEVMPSPDIDNPENGLPSVIHLAKSYKGKIQYVRLVSVNQMWGSVIDRDMESGIVRANQLKQRLRSREVEMLNMYMFPFTPPDGVFERILDSNMSSHSAILVQSAYVDLQQLNVEGENKLKPFGIRPHLFLNYYHEPLDQSTESLISELKQKETSREQEARKLFNAGKPKWSIVFIAINIIMFLILTLNGGSTNPNTLIQYGAKYNPLIQDEQYWRLLTPIFLHIGFPHLLFNSMALYFIGPAVERIYGGYRFIFIFLLAGVMGSLASFAFTPNLSAGASGAIFGCFGALLFFGQKHRALFFQTMGKDILFFLGLNLMIGFVFPGIDNFGHIGGLLGGYLAAATVGIPKEKHSIIVRMVFILALLIIMTAMFTVGMV